ncbi:MAG: hypothetical protein WCA77_01220 [Thermoplasmata archaeon]
MQRRTAVVIAIDGALLGLIILGFFYPFLSIPVLVALVVWLGVLFFFRRPFGFSRPAPSPAGAGGASSKSSSVRGIGAVSSGTPSPTDFCMICGTTVPAGTTSCPTCHRPVPFL